MVIDHIPMEKCDGSFRFPFVVVIFRLWICFMCVNAYDTHHRMVMKTKGMLSGALISIKENNVFNCLVRINMNEKTLNLKYL